MNHDSRSFEDDLSSVKADLAVIRSNYATKEDLQELRIELKGEIHALQTELKGDIQALRTELKGDVQALRTELKTEIGGLGAELRADISGLRIEIEKLRTEMQAMRADFHKALHAQTWKMYGFGVVMVAAVHFVTRAGY
jgi:uncharacterized protein involved in exopolysaccharide biosynthesis